MNILINCSNLKAGGGIQVADSICGLLDSFGEHIFIVVLSSKMECTKKRIADYPNIKAIFSYDVKNNLQTLLFGRDGFLDKCVVNNGIQAVLTVFGPSRWKPRVPHLCGFARAQLVLTDSPYYKRISLKERIVYRLWTYLFKRSSYIFYTENKYISSLLPGLLGSNIRTYTVTNYYNQVFDTPEQWKKTVQLPEFDGVTCLSVSSHYLHKNFEIIKDIVYCLRNKYPGFKVRFVLTFEEDEMPVPADIRDSILYIGKIEVSECPFLYEQSDIMFMPTLMECFTATYPEAMRMGVPIVTTDLEFARGLCGVAACYYSAIDAKAAAEAIYKVATVKSYSELLVENGKNQLLKYDNYEQRTEKLIRILEEIAK